MRIVRAEGEGLARGTVIGKELADLIGASIDFYHRYLEARGVSSEQLHDLLARYLFAAEIAYPDAVAVLKGMAIGATVPILELFAINALEELETLLESREGDVRTPTVAHRAPVERCSSLTVRLPDTTLIAHNENWLAGDLGNVAVVIDRPEGGRVPIASPTIVACLPAVGLNAHGTGQGVDSLTAFDDGVGIPRVFVSRSSLDARDRADAFARAAMPGRAGGYAYVFGFPDDACIVETSGREHRVLDHAGPHTNHYLDPELATLAPRPSEGSVARLGRLRELLAERQPTTPEDLMDIMRDHGSVPQAVCLHPDPAEGEEASAVLFSMVADVAARRMWVTAGNPCESEFEEIDLTELTD